MIDSSSVVLDPSSLRPSSPAGDFISSPSSWLVYSPIARHGQAPAETREPGNLFWGIFPSSGLSFTACCLAGDFLFLSRASARRT
jgi:hypothetical protein